MGNIIIDDIVRFRSIKLQKGEDVFTKILDNEKGSIDSKRFFLHYIPRNILSQYDLNDKQSTNELRRLLLSVTSPVKEMGGCNLHEDYIKKGFRYNGIKLSDPEGKILGQFDFRDDQVTYSPIFPLFYEERDLIKWADKEFITDVPFEEILLNRINNASKFYLHCGYFRRLSDLATYGEYRLHNITKENMIEFATNPSLGEQKLKEYLYR